LAAHIFSWLILQQTDSKKPNGNSENLLLTMKVSSHWIEGGHSPFVPKQHNLIIDSTSCTWEKHSQISMEFDLLISPVGSW